MLKEEVSNGICGKTAEIVVGRARAMSYWGSLGLVGSGTSG